MKKNKLRNMKMIFIIIIYLISLLINTIKVFGAEIANSNDDIIEPRSDQYLELRAVEIKDIEGQNKQVIMELWGNNIEFKRI